MTMYLISAPPTNRLPFIGKRIMIRRTLVEHRGLCRVSLVIAPLELGADQAEHNAHLAESFARGLAMWGTTHGCRQS